jgi:hypothetical protein|tara:strand:+ start:18921 stop:20507 length:1587 start_codon:yes stop_codon:yes gene_type:complete
MYKDNKILDPVKSLNFSADLVEVFGNIKLENGSTLKQALIIDGFSFWDVVSPELAHSHIPKILASNHPPGFFDIIKSYILSMDFIFRKINLTKNKTVIEPVLGEINVLCLGFVTQMYRDVINPIVTTLDKHENINTLILSDKRWDKLESAFSNRCSFQSIWSFWNEDSHIKAAEIEIAICNVQKVTEDMNVFLDALPEDIKHLSGHFKILFRTLFNFYLPRIARQVVVARKVLNLYKPKITVSPDVSDSRARIYTILARQLGITSLDVQFGLAGKEAVEWRFLYADYVAAWGQLSKEAILNQGISPNRIIVTGSPRHDYQFAFSNQEMINQRRSLGVPDNAKLFVLASTYTLKTHNKYSDPEILKGMKNAVFDAFRDTPNAFLLVKPHPVENESENKALIGHSQNIVQVSRDSDIRELIKICDNFISFGSTATIDALIARKLTICPIFPGWVFSNFFKKSNSVIIPTSAAEMKAVVKDIVVGLGEKLSPNDDARKEFLKKHIFTLDGNSALRIEKVILDIITQEKNFD